jgi:DAHL domain-containing protein
VNRNALLVLGVLLVGSAAWLVDATQLWPRAALHEGDVQRIDALLAARAAFEVSVLEARAGLQSSFDPINRALSSMREATSVAEALQTRGAVYAAAAERVALAARALESEEPSVEQYKTDLALLRLSSHHFPLAADALIRRAEADARKERRGVLAGQLATLGALRTGMERLDELPAREDMQRLEQGLSKLQTLRASLDDGGREALDMLSGHTRSILDRRERVDHVARSLVRSPVRAQLEAARAVYERSSRRQAQKAGALQMLSGVLALTGVVVLASVVLRSARARRA